MSMLGNLETFQIVNNGLQAELPIYWRQAFSGHLGIIEDLISGKCFIFRFLSVHSFLMTHACLILLDSNVSRCTFYVPCMPWSISIFAIFINKLVLYLEELCR